MDEEELREEMKSLIDEEGLEIETPWQKQQREAKRRHDELTYRLPSEAERRRERRNTFWIFTGLSVLEIGYLLRQPPKFSTWQDWIIVAGAIFFSVRAILSFISMRNEWTTPMEDRVVTRAFGYMILGPIVIVVGGIMMYSVFGWLGIIRSWVAVIIVLE